VAAFLYAAVFTFRAASDDIADAIALLYIVPIALVALELGLRAGVAAAGLALGLLGLWVLDTQAEIGALGMMTRGVAFLAVGGVAGRFSDRMRDAQRRQAGLLRAGFDTAHLDLAEELPATLAQNAVEQVEARGARVELDGRTPAEDGVMADGAHEFPIEARGVRYGRLTVSPSRRLQPEAHAALATLALQVAVSVENRQLLERERERAVIAVQLRDARRLLDERAIQLRGLIAGQEAERRHVSRELHEEAAQTLAAVLLGLGALERRLDSDAATPQVAMLRTHVDHTMRSLRALAVSLRPPTLELGLRAALERLAETHGDAPVMVAIDDEARLDEYIETTIFRVAEEALDATVGAARSISVLLRPDDRELTILIETDRAFEEEKVAMLRARLELVGGNVSGSHTALRASVPLRSQQLP
jgi:signal transduction histidine kinase